MQITPEIRAQLDEQKKQCVFCKIVGGEIPAKTVFEDDKTLAALDINPIIKGHTLYMLKEHYPIMPYIQAHEFKHYFGILGQLASTIQNATIRTGVNIFIANGYVAGQQAPHFLLHILPRDNGDGFFNFLFKMKFETSEKTMSMLGNNLPIMMKNHFGRNPASWHKSTGEKLDVSGTVIYEDEKTIAFVPKKGAVEGHIIIHSKEENSDIGKLSIESSSHLFYVASFAATAIFEGLGAQGTNIIVKSGYSDDNPEGKLEVHILPRRENDDLKYVNWQPKQGDGNLDGIMAKIKDKTWKVKYVEEKKEVKELKVQTKVNPLPQALKIEKTKKQLSPQEEIERAIKKAQK
jgi:histidine triad (HIT) family protein